MSRGRSSFESCWGVVGTLHQVHRSLKITYEFNNQGISSWGRVKFNPKAPFG